MVLIFFFSFVTFFTANYFYYYPVEKGILCAHEKRMVNEKKITRPGRTSRSRKRNKITSAVVFRIKKNKKIIGRRETKGRVGFFARAAVSSGGEIVRLSEIISK